MSKPDLSETLGQLFGGVKRLGTLYFEKARLKTTEKITILLATIAFTAVLMAVIMVCLVFISIGIGHLLATTIAPHWAYLFIAAFYVLLLVLVIAFRRPLFVDPISRFMSRLLVEEPEEDRAYRLYGSRPAPGHHPKPQPEPEPEAQPRQQDDEAPLTKEQIDIIEAHLQHRRKPNDNLFNPDSHDETPH